MESFFCLYESTWKCHKKEHLLKIVHVERCSLNFSSWLFLSCLNLSKCNQLCSSLLPFFCYKTVIFTLSLMRCHLYQHGKNREVKVAILCGTNNNNNNNNKTKQRGNCMQPSWPNRLGQLVSVMVWLTVRFIIRDLHYQWYWKFHMSWVLETRRKKERGWYPAILTNKFGR